MSDINAYEYGLLQEQDNPAKKVKPTELPIKNINENMLNRFISCFAYNVPCPACPFDCEESATFSDCKERLTKFFCEGV